MSASYVYEQRFPLNNEHDVDVDDRDEHEELDELDGYDSPTAGSDPSRRQRPKIRRCRLTQHQLQTLSRVFEQDSQPSMDSRIALGTQLGM
jgi:hypothetical protein